MVFFNLNVINWYGHLETCVLSGEESTYLCAQGAANPAVLTNCNLFSAQKNATSD